MLNGCLAPPRHSESGIVRLKGSFCSRPPRGGNAYSVRGARVLVPDPRPLGLRRKLGVSGDELCLLGLGPLLGDLVHVGGGAVQLVDVLLPVDRVVGLLLGLPVGHVPLGQDQVARDEALLVGADARGDEGVSDLDRVVALGEARHRSHNLKDEREPA